jgi:hypothetical protein
MSEETEIKPLVHKIWRNPAAHGQPVAYLGEYYPPTGRLIFVAQDLRDLGFGPGEYTILAPSGRRYPKLLPKWQKLSVPGV